MSRRRGRALHLAALLSTCLLVASCSGATDGGPDSETSDASADPFCEVVESHRARYISATESLNNVDGLIALGAAVGEIRVMWEDLVAIAPPEIATDLTITRDAWIKAEESAMSGDVAGALVNAVLRSGSASRVNQYIADACGEEYAPFGVTSGPSADPFADIQTAAIREGTWEDDLGYTYAVTIMSPWAVTTDVNLADAPPGKALVSVLIYLMVRVENTTPGRNAELPSIALTAAWEVDGPECEALGEWDNLDATNYCGRVWGNGSDGSVTLASGESLTFVSTTGTLTPLQVPEGDAEALAAGFAFPAAFAVTLSRPFDQYGSQGCIAWLGDGSIC